MRDLSKITESRVELEREVLSYIPNHQRDAIIGINMYVRYYEDHYSHWTAYQKEMSDQKLLHVLNMTCKMLELSKMKEEKQRLIYFWAGLLHDFGRVTDIQKGTFKGSTHAQDGVELLFKDGLIEKFPIDKEFHIYLKKAIYLHGVGNIEETIKKEQIKVSDFELELCKDLRTADKWDIMEFLLKEPTVITVGATEEEIAKMPVSELTLYELTHNKPVERNSKEEEYTHMRHFLSHVGFIYDITDKRLIEYCYEVYWVERYLSKLKEPADTDSLNKIYESAMKYMEDYLKKPSTKF